MKRILVAVDTTETSKLVIARAVDLARATGAKLRLVRAVSIPPPLAPPGVMIAPAEQPEQMVASAEASLRGLLAEVPEELRDGCVAELGTPADVICSVARAYDAEVVVIGAHKYGVVARVLGTTAAKVVNRIDRPVFVVRSAPSAPAVAGMDAAGHQGTGLS